MIKIWWIHGKVLRVKCKKKWDGWSRTKEKNSSLFYICLDIHFLGCWTGTNSQSSTSIALPWIQCKLGKQYLLNKVTPPWESNPEPFSYPGNYGYHRSVCWVKKNYMWPWQEKLAGGTTVRVARVERRLGTPCSVAKCNCTEGRSEKSWWDLHARHLKWLGSSTAIWNWGQWIM